MAEGTIIIIKDEEKKKKYMKKLNKKRNNENRRHSQSEEVSEIYHAVIKNHGNSLCESIGSVILLDKCSVSQAKATLVMHELKYRKISYDPYQVYCLSGYQYETDAKNGFYKWGYDEN